jgi:hypothetical protein
MHARAHECGRRDIKRELGETRDTYSNVRSQTRFPLAAASALQLKEPYSTTSALRSSQRQLPELGLLSKEASLALQKVRGK